MDTGEGRFEQVKDDLKATIDEFKSLFPKSPGQIFKVGETLEIRGSLFTVENIGQHKLRLKLLPR